MNFVAHLKIFKDIRCLKFTYKNKLESSFLPETYLESICLVNPFVLNAPFLYPLKT